MYSGKSLFNEIVHNKEDIPVEQFRNLDSKVAEAIQKVKTLKDEKAALERRIKELEDMLTQKDADLMTLREEKTSIKEQIEELLGELEAIEVR